MEIFEREIYRHYFQVGGFVPMPNKTERVHLDFLVEHYDAFFFDAFGTFYCRDNYVYPGAVEMYEKVRRSGKPMRLVTNAASSSISKMMIQLDQMNIPFAPSEIISSGTLFPDFAQKIGICEAFYVGKKDGQEHLTAGGVRATEFPSENTVIVSSQSKDPAVFDRALEILKRPNAKLIVLNPDAWAPRIGHNREGVSGYFAHKLYLEAKPQTYYLGKPFKGIYEKALATLPQPMRTVMIGDTLATDCGGAMNAGIDSALLIGRNQPADELDADEKFLNLRPTYYLNLT